MMERIPNEGKGIDKISFKVAPYALYDVLWAFERINHHNAHEHYETTVTKEDNDLIVVVTKEDLRQTYDSRNSLSGDSQ